MPSLGGLSIFDVEPSYILAVLRRIERRKTFTTAEKVRTWLNQLFRYAKVEKGVRYNPASDLDIVAAPRPPMTHNPLHALLIERLFLSGFSRGPAKSGSQAQQRTHSLNIMTALQDTFYRYPGAKDAPSYGVHEPGWCREVAFHRGRRTK